MVDRTTIDLAGVIRDAAHPLTGAATDNDAQPPGTPKAGFYGIDLYSLYSSIEAVLGYLEKVNPQAAQQARARYACFEQFGADPQSYGYATSFGAAESCADAAVNQLLDF